ncbi:hypothetical protein D3C80_1626710 [compost metagenome]
MTAVTRARMASARAASPAARSSMTRSIIERAKVTPQAFTAWRSQGASRRIFELSPPAVTRSVTDASRSPSSARTWAMGSGSSNRSRMVGASFEVMSTIAPSLMVTSAGPSISDRQTRPTKVPMR